MYQCLHIIWLYIVQSGLLNGSSGNKIKDLCNRYIRLQLYIESERTDVILRDFLISPFNFISRYLLVKKIVFILSFSCTSNEIGAKIQFRPKSDNKLAYFLTSITLDAKHEKIFVKNQYFFLFTVQSRVTNQEIKFLSKGHSI